MFVYFSSFKGVKMWSLNITTFTKAMSKEQVQLLISKKIYYHLLTLL